MNHKLIQALLERCENHKQESDFAYFWASLITAEALAKTIVLGMLAAVADDTQRNRYRLTYNLVRANGMGDWADVLTDVLSGPSSQFLSESARLERKLLTENCPLGSWQHDAVTLLAKASDAIGIKYDSVGSRANMTSWFRMFATFRNKTRGHGATNLTPAGEASKYLYPSIVSVYENFHLFQRPWAYLYRNLSGKYRVSTIGHQSEQFDYLKREATHSFDNGIYIYFDIPKRVPLIESDPELTDFFLPNGGFSDKRFELLSYLTDDKQTGDSKPYLTPPDVQKSETHGYGELIARGNCFSNAPEPYRHYVRRPELESDLLTLLEDSRHRVVTLQGAGGVGKTSLTLQVIDGLYSLNRFELVVWFSARDIDLLPSGPRTVSPGVLSPDNIAERFVLLVRPTGEIQTKKRANYREYFQQQLSVSDGGPTLFVFDNFETVQNPVEMFTWIESHTDLPNKVLITTRLRDFKGDYPLEVHGMTEEEARTLIERTASSLKITSLLTEGSISDLITTSGGHPYVMKILLGEMAITKKSGALRPIIAKSDDILIALFERTYGELSPCGKRAFLTLAAWNSAVPRVALEAVLLGSTKELSEVDRGIESLYQYSLADRVTTERGQEFIGLPLAASEFGKKKLKIDVSRATIMADVRILQMFSPSSVSDVKLNLGKVLSGFIRNLSGQIDAGGDFSDYEPILNMVCRSYNPGWLLLAQWRLERGSPQDLDAAISNIQSFLQSDPVGNRALDAWQMLARAYDGKHDIEGRIHAFIQRAQIPSVPFHDISNTANLLNRDYGKLELEPDVKRLMSQELLDVFQKRSEEADADDFSRMAWLALHLRQIEKAKKFVDRGLEIDPQNIHCVNLESRLRANMSSWDSR